MSNIQEKVVPSGQHYSGTNRIPNIKQFMDSLDSEKKRRDAQIDAQLLNRARPGDKPSGEVSEHTASEATGGKRRRIVTDPVTGKGMMSSQSG